MMIRSLDGMVEMVLSMKKKHRIAVACGYDPNTIVAAGRSVTDGLVEAILIGSQGKIKDTCDVLGIDPALFGIIDVPGEEAAINEAVRMVRNDEADILMKGLVGTDMFLKAVMDRNNGLMMNGAVLSYVGVLSVPAYHKLLFVTDTAVIPFPTLDQKCAMARYALEMANRFGVENPRIALISASEKRSRHFESSADYPEMCRMAENGYFGNCIMDGPLDVFLACDKMSVDIKGVKTPVDGDADILLFPSLESSNPFYKGLMLFAGSELAGLIRGTEHPVVVMSRSESERSKYYCIALACLMS